MIKKAPRNTLKAMMKTKMKSKLGVKITTDAMVELAVLIFLKSLAEEASTKAFEEKTVTIRAHHIEKINKKMLKKARG